MTCNRIFGTLCAAILAVSALPCSAAALTLEPLTDDHEIEFVPFDEETLPGDINNNGTLEINDAVLLARFITEYQSAEISDIGLQNADVCADGLLNSLDVLQILQILAKS